MSAPSSASEAQSSSLTLTVRVHERGNEEPISGALVLHDSAGSYTDTAGESQVTVEPGRETTIRVSAPGFRPMQASAVLNSDERWTFFLETEPSL